MSRADAETKPEKVAAAIGYSLGIAIGWLAIFACFVIVLAAAMGLAYLIRWLF